MEQLEKLLRRDICAKILGTDKIDGDLLNLLFLIGTISEYEINQNYLETEYLRKYYLKVTPDSGNNVIRNINIINHYYETGLKMSRIDLRDDTTYFAQQIIYKGAMTFKSIYKDSSYNIERTLEKIEILLENETSNNIVLRTDKEKQFQEYAKILSKQLEEVEKYINK